jgi:hypothetical protein
MRRERLTLERIELPLGRGRVWLMEEEKMVGSVKLNLFGIRMNMYYNQCNTLDFSLK